VIEQLGVWLGDGVNAAVTAVGGILVFTIVGMLLQRWHDWRVRKYLRELIALQRLTYQELLLNRGGGEHGFDKSGADQQEGQQGVQQDQGVRPAGAQGK